MKKVYLSWQDVENHTQEILRQIQKDKWLPDYVVGLTRGGLVPANLISQYLGCRMETLKVSLRDGTQQETNCWMAEDAFGYPNQERFIENPVDVSGILEVANDLLEQGATYKNILIVDDINDSGATLNWIKQDWQSSCFPNDPTWNSVWGNNVRVAVLYDNETSKSELDISYSSVTINKAEEDQWIVFPWEDWWQNDRR